MEKKEMIFGSRKLGSRRTSFFAVYSELSLVATP